MLPTKPLQHRFHAWLSDNPEDSILRWIFRSVLAVTVAALAVDLATSNGWIGQGDASAAVERRLTSSESDLQNTPSGPTPRSDASRRPVPVPLSQGAMTQTMTFELASGGRLMATGTITPGISEAFAAEIANRGDSIKTVVLNSPGGSVVDAMAIGRLIRERKLTTEVEPGKTCASSCPLALAGGIERRVGDKALIGVHQVAVSNSTVSAAPRDDMDVAQRISARCQRYLGDMGVSVQVWVHAMETPHDKLFVFRSDEMRSLNLTTGTASAAAASKS